MVQLEARQRELGFGREVVRWELLFMGGAGLRVTPDAAKWRRR